MTDLMPWILFNIFILFLLAFDLGVLHRKDKEMSVSGALWKTLGSMVISLIFAGGILHFMGEAKGFEFHRLFH